MNTLRLVNRSRCVGPNLGPNCLKKYNKTAKVTTGSLGAYGVLNYVEITN